jgi:hypothetical protein
MRCVDYRAIGNRNGHGFLRRIADRFLWRTLSGGEPPLILSGCYTHSVSEDRMAAAGAMLTAIFSHAADRSGLKAD